MSEPKFCKTHPASKALWRVDSTGFCKECKDEAYAAAAKANRSNPPRDYAYAVPKGEVGK